MEFPQSSERVNRKNQHQNNFDRQLCKTQGLYLFRKLSFKTGSGNYGTEFDQLKSKLKKATNKNM